MKQLVLALAIVLTLASVFDATVVRAKDGKHLPIVGSITSERDDTPLPGARIDIIDMKSRTVADSNGNFTFQNVPEGLHILRVTFGGYLTLLDSVEVTDSMRLDLELKAEKV